MTITPDNEYLLEIDARGLNLEKVSVQSSLDAEKEAKYKNDLERKKIIDAEAKEKMRQMLVKKAEADLFYGKKCTICNYPGINLNDNCSLIDAAVLNYLLYECSKCRSMVHRDCIPWDLPDFYDPKGNNLHLWKCAFCKSSTSMNNCLICNTNMEGLRKTVGNNNVHYVCAQVFGINIQNEAEVM